MRTRLFPLLYATLLLTACDGSSLSSAADVSPSDDSTHIRFESVDFQQQGGVKCPEAEMSVGTDADTAPTAENALCATVKFKYPKLISDVKPELVEKLNRSIMTLLMENPVEGVTRKPETPEQFAGDFIADYKQTPNPFSSWELERSVGIVFTTKNMITLLFEEYGYTGGAHPYSGARYSVLSLADGNQITLDDLLKPGHDAALNVAGERIFRETRELKEEETLEEQGFSFPNDVFSLNDNFGVLKEGLDFIFNSYEIAPYALGPTQFTVPYEDIQELISPQGELGQATD